MSNVLNTVELVARMTTELESQLRIMEKLIGAGTDYTNAIKTPSSYLNTQKKIVENNKELQKSLKETTKTERALQTERKKRESQLIKESNLREKLTRQKEKQQIQDFKQLRQSTKLASAWNQLNQKLQQAELRYKNLAASQGLSNKQTIRAQREVNKLRANIDRINTPIKRFNNNVGNYKSALKGATTSLRGFMGAFGMIGGVFLFARAIQDTFKRIKEFDKEMQNMAGILRTSRIELLDLEKTIKKVAGASIKTSNEVAKLATSLLVLGKSKSEVKLLLKPVNDLSIALGSTSDETGEFLVQTLNAFGKSAESGQEFADVIAGIRTSTSLDFQKMRDSFQYITPISKILNKDLAETGALVGLLADNGLKAEQAGRVLATAQIKLATSGKTLEDGLKEINDAYRSGATELEVLKVANDLFGKQAAKIGVILATNTDRLEEYEKKIRSSTGALDDLVNEQLKSLDAQLKILNASWEEFILNIENGQGSIAGVFSSLINFTTKAINSLNRLQAAQDGVFSSTGKSKGFLGYLKDAIPWTALIETEYDKLIDKQKEFNLLNDDLDGQKVVAYADAIQLLQSKLDKGNLSENMSKLYQAEIDYLKDIVKQKTEIVKVDKKEKDTIEPKKEIIKITKKQREEVKALNKTLKRYKSTLEELQVTESFDEEGYLDKVAALRKLRNETDKFIDSFSSGFLGSIGLGSLDKFFDGTFDKLLLGAETMEEKFAVHFNAIAEVAEEAFSFISQASQQNFDAEYARLEQKRDISLQFAGESTSAREEIERQYEDRRKAIQTRQAKAEKKQALFKVAIDTAQAIVSSIAKSPETFGLPFSAFAAAAGLAQSAIIASQQIPQFWQGGTVEQGGTIMVNDDPFGKKGSNYKEVAETPKGQLLFPQGKNVKMNVPKGTKIHSTYTDFLNDINSNLFKPNNIAPIDMRSGIIPMIQNNGMDKNDLKEVFSNEIGRLNNTIKNKPNATINMNEKGFKKYLTKGMVKREILNARFTGKGLEM